jgi:hypothetical protein
MELMKEPMSSPAKLPRHSKPQILMECVVVYDWPTVFCVFDRLLTLNLMDSQILPA